MFSMTTGLSPTLVVVIANSSSRGPPPPAMTRMPTLERSRTLLPRRANHNAATAAVKLPIPPIHAPSMVRTCTVCSRDIPISHERRWPVRPGMSTSDSGEHDELVRAGPIAQAVQVERAPQPHGAEGPSIQSSVSPRRWPTCRPRSMPTTNGSPTRAPLAPTRTRIAPSRPRRRSTSSRSTSSSRGGWSRRCATPSTSKASARRAQPRSPRAHAAASTGGSTSSSPIPRDARPAVSPRRRCLPRAAPAPPATSTRCTTGRSREAHSPRGRRHSSATCSICPIRAQVP